MLGDAAGGVAVDEIVVGDHAVDRRRLILDEEALTRVVVQVVAPEDQVVSDPHRLEAVVVIAVFAHVGDLVALDQQAVPITVGIVVAIRVDRILTELPDQLVATIVTSLIWTVELVPASIP